MALWIRVVLGVWVATLAVLAVLALGVGFVVAMLFFGDWGDHGGISVIIVNESQSHNPIVRLHFPEGRPGARDLPLHEPLPHGETTSYGAARDNYPQRVVVIGEGGITLFDDVVGPENPDDREFTIVVR